MGLAGQLDVEGGRCFLPGENWVALANRRQLETPDFDRSIAKGRFPVYSHFCGGEPHAHLLPKAIIDGEPPAIRSLLVFGASLQTSWPEPELKKALGSLDFLVCIDRQLTQDAAYADIVLPAATAFEQESYCYYGSALRMREQIIEPVGEARPDIRILTELAGHLGYGDPIPKARGSPRIHPERFRLYGGGRAEGGPPPGQKEACGHDLSQMGDRASEGGRPAGIRDADRQIRDQIHDPGHVRISGASRIQGVRRDPSNPGLHALYPLILGTGPFKPDMNLCLRAIPDFKEKYPFPTVEMNEKDAFERGIADGDAVIIKTSRGSVPMRASVSDAIMEGFVYAAVGGGGPLGTEEWQRANVNTVTDFNQYDEISGFPVYKTLLCDVRKKKRQRRGIAVQDPSLGCAG